tara:strand:+ start:628 stop:1455 length:828 start_codon:yes stop_codon:yes gene_type:complete
LREWTEEMQRRWIQKSSEWISMKAIETNPSGLELASKSLIDWMERIGFDIETHVDPEASYRPIIIASKPPSSGNNWIGFFHHYDVEPANEEEWNTDPWDAEVRDGMLFGRGIADNIGPFVQRLIYIEENMPDVGLLFVIQGEEEIGSPWAHQVYPILELPDVDFWIDETGYFFKNGDQRVLYVGESETIDRINLRLSEINQLENKETKIRNRVMSKAFGENRCPCIAHLLKGKAYLAIGPNDDSIRVHGIDEAMDMSYLPLCASHLKIVFEEALV